MLILESTVDHRLDSLGFSEFFAAAARDIARPELLPARVAADHGSAVRLLGADPAPFTAPATADLCVGDWVLVDPPSAEAPARVVLRLPRRTELVRQAAGAKTKRQAIAANLDVVFIVTAMGGDLSPRRLERYLAAVHASGADPVIVVNKADLDFSAALSVERDLPPGVPVVVTSTLIDHGLDALRSHLGVGRTAGFVGSSGVGKSSLVNALSGSQVMVTAGIRESDGKGCHTTTHRELRLLAHGVVVDTPGMRELALWSGEGLQAVFEDLEALAEACRFRDCAHENEPGCALLDGIDDGTVDPERVQSWRKLREEVRRHELRKDPVALRASQRAFARQIKNTARIKKVRR